VLFISGTEGDTRRYRCVHQQEQLALNGVESAFREAGDFRMMSDILTYELFIFHRVPYSELVGDALDMIDSLGKIAVFDADDLVFDPSLLPHHRIMDTMAPDARRRYRMQVEGQCRTFERCAYVLTATQFLAEVARQRGKRAFVNRNSLSQEMLTISEDAYVERRKRLELQEKEDRVVVAYFSGTGSHNRDFLVITDSLIRILEAYDHVELHISGQLSLSEDFAPFTQRIRRAPYLPWRELPFLIAAVDINLAPLEPENPFCRAKSALKYFEAGVMGVPTVASRVDPFEQAIVHGTNGLLAQGEKEWTEALALLIEDAGKRAAIGKAARRDVYQNYLPGPRGRHLVSVLECIRCDWQSRVMGARLPSGPDGRVSELADSQRKVISALERHLSRQQDLIVQKEDQLQGQRRVIEDRERTLSQLRRRLSEEIAKLQLRLEERGKLQAQLEALQTQLGESERSRVRTEARMDHWKNAASSQQERHREELRRILASLRSVGGIEMTVAGPEAECTTPLLLQRIREVILQMREVEEARQSSLRAKMGRAWQRLRRGQVGALRRSILVQLRRKG